MIFSVAENVSSLMVLNLFSLEYLRGQSWDLSCLFCKMVVYADDVLLYKPIEANTDYSRMQEDVNTIEHWMTCNFLTLNATKCKQMSITRSKTHQPPQLYLANQPLDLVQSYKYLGVTITSNLSWSDHIQTICNKSRRFVGLLYCQFYDSADSNTLCQFCLSCIRPHLEYACQVWYPHLSKEITLLENMQKFVAKPGTWTTRECWYIWIFLHCSKGGYRSSPI